METGQKGGFGLPCVLIFLKFFYFFHEIFSIPIRPNHLSPRRCCLLRHGHTYRCEEIRFPITRNGHTYRSNQPRLIDSRNGHTYRLNQPRLIDSRNGRTYRPNQPRPIDTRHGHTYRCEVIRFVSIDC